VFFLNMGYEGTVLYVRGHACLLLMVYLFSKLAVKFTSYSSFCKY